MIRILPIAADMQDRPVRKAVDILKHIQIQGLHQLPMPLVCHQLILHALHTVINSIDGALLKKASHKAFRVLRDAFRGLYHRLRALVEEPDKLPEILIVFLKAEADILKR